MSDVVFTYLVIAEDGSSHEHHHRMADTDAIEDVVRAALGGWPEYVRVGDPAVALWCDEDGGPRRRSANVVGSLLVLLLGGCPAVFVGPIVVTGKRGDRLVSLTAEQVEHLVTAVQLCRG